MREFSAFLKESVAILGLGEDVWGVFDEKTLMFLTSEKSVDKDQLIKNSQAATKFYLVLDAELTSGILEIRSR